MGLLLYAFGVLAGASVDLDDIALIDEGRRRDLGARFNLDDLCHVGRRVALGTGRTFDHFEFNVIRRRQSNRAIVEQHHRARHAVLEEFPGIVDLGLGQFVLVKSLAVHEDKRFTLAVQVLDIDFVDVGRFQFVAAFVGSGEACPGDQVLHLALVERVSFARFDEVHFCHQIGLAFNLNLESLAKFTGLVRRHELLFLANDQNSERAADTFRSLPISLAVRLPPEDRYDNAGFARVVGLVPIDH